MSTICETSEQKEEFNVLERSAQPPFSTGAHLATLGDNSGLSLRQSCLHNVQLGLRRLVGHLQLMELLDGLLLRFQRLFQRPLPLSFDQEKFLPVKYTAWHQSLLVPYLVSHAFGRAQLCLERRGLLAVILA